MKTEELGEGRAVVEESYKPERESGCQIEGFRLKKRGESKWKA